MADRSLFDFLRKEVHRMSSGIGMRGAGNIHPLIMHEVERCVILAVLEYTNSNFLVASKLLGISRGRLYRRIASLGIQASDNPKTI